MANHILLICTVGGTPEVVAAGIKGCQPSRIVFVASPQTCQDVEGKILPLLSSEGISFSPGQYEVIQVASAQDFAECVERLRKSVSEEAQKWFQRGQDYRLIADFTGGTKCMSAALALVCRRLPCRFSYVGGTERTKGGVGVVINGKEEVLHTDNPWDSMGYQAVEDGIALFNNEDYEAAIHTLGECLPRIERPDLKKGLVSLRLLAEAYLAWDLFDHRTSAQKLREVLKNANDIRSIFPYSSESLLGTIKSQLSFLTLFTETEPGRHTILDLCANAQRCHTKGHYDDAVARLYRAVEAIAQFQLRDLYNIPDTGKVPLDMAPEPLRTKWSSRTKEGKLLLGLQDDYQLLETLGDKLAQRFKDLGLAGKESLLAARNQSILAHGFQPVAKKTADGLWQVMLKLAEIREDELPKFPRIS